MQCTGCSASKVGKVHTRGKGSHDWGAWEGKLEQGHTIPWSNKLFLLNVPTCALQTLGYLNDLNLGVGPVHLPRHENDFPEEKVGEEAEKGMVYKRANANHPGLVCVPFLLDCPACVALFGSIAFPMPPVLSPSPPQVLREIRHRVLWETRQRASVAESYFQIENLWVFEQ